MEKKRPGQLPSTKELEELKELFRHHIESFDYMIDEGLELMLKLVKPVQIFDSFSNKTLRNILFFFVICFIGIFVFKKNF